MASSAAWKQLLPDPPGVRHCGPQAPGQRPSRVSPSCSAPAPALRPSSLPRSPAPDQLLLQGLLGRTIFKRLFPEPPANPGVCRLAPLTSWGPGSCFSLAFLPPAPHGLGYTLRGSR